VHLQVTAISREELVCSRDEVEFGCVMPGQTPSATVDVIYTGPLAWQVREAIVPNEAPFEATVKERFRRPGEVAYQVKVSLKKDASPGQFQGLVLLKTNNPYAPVMQVPVRGNIQAPLQVVPAALNLKEVTPGATLTRRVSIRSVNRFEVVGIEGLNTAKLGGPPLPNQVQTVKLEIVAPSQEGPFHYEAKIKTNLQDAPLVVTIDGIVAKK
jgi:hypothetical protein